MVGADRRVRVWHRFREDRRVRKLITKALMSLVLDKKARQKWEKSRNRRASLETAKEDRAAAEKAAMAAAKQIVTEERQELIAQAIKVHRAKTRVLADLSDADRRKLYVMAMRTFLGKDPDESGGSKH